MNIQTDIVIVGGGIAALHAAHKLAPHFGVHLLTKADVTMSSSYKAQGGIAAVMASHDQSKFHLQDTLVAGEFHHHEDNVRLLVEKGSTCIKKLLAEGFPADYDTDGKLALGLEGAHSRNRIVHAGGDATGKHLINHYIQTLPDLQTVQIHTYEFAYELLLNQVGECCGVCVKTATGSKTYYASYVIVATGGAGALYSCTSNHANSYGDGIALAYLAGAAVTDMEFMQFHPSLLYKGGAHGLISEAVRGAGGRFVDVNGKAIMEGKHPLGDLAPRHVTAFEMHKMRVRGQEVFIDISMIEQFPDKFPTITRLCEEQQIDVAHGKIPIAPGSHFLMGGVIAKANGETSIPRLHAIGEVACTGVHGANRLASNSLLEGLVFAEEMTSHLIQNGIKQSNFVPITKQKSTSLPPLLPIQELQQLMSESAGIVRTTSALQTLLNKLPDVDSTVDLSRYTQQQIEQYFMHITASLIVRAALTRTESRGAHIRTEFRQQDIWTKKWIVFEKGKMNVRNTLYEYNQTENNATAIFQ